MPFTLGDIATTGLPVGEHIVRIDDIEASINADKTGETMVFKTSVAQSENPKVKVGAKQIWSYTYAQEWRSIIANDLIRAGLDKGLFLEGNAKADAITLNSHMRGQYYVIRVSEQKKDPTRLNTNIVRPYTLAGGAAAPTPAAAPAPIAAPAPAAVAPAPVAAVPPPAAVAPPAAITPAPAAAVPPPAVPAPVAPPVPVAAAPVAPVAPPAPAAPTEPGLDAALIQAVTLGSQGQGAYPPLNGRQIAQLREIGMPDVAAAYEAAAAPAAVAPAPAATAFAAV